ncbi:DUF6270 domain-containing protein [Arthrobacter sp. CAL618]|uniref:DUF6270 domain-containing protein n=1 Tax=Arthrobacter sp. CAL618 TaxID=1055770 RepID=UPI00041D1D9D|nr:DUF6270 domain-containing protein [Arthrobacter sp. CAL618]
MTNIFIYGSCVARDTYEYFDQKKHPLMDYVARQSLISAFSEPVDLSARDSDLASAFQVKNLQGDLDGDLTRRIQAQSAACGILIWDLADERLGVIDCGQGQYITRSVELVRSGLLERLPESRWIRFGTPEHFDLWKLSVHRFAVLLENQKLIDRILLLDIPWSMYNQFGKQTKGIVQISPDEANNLYAEYIQVVLAEMNLRKIGISWNQSISNTDHKWTESPYHYHETVYQAMVEKINNLTEERLRGNIFAEDTPPVHNGTINIFTRASSKNFGEYVEVSFNKPLSEFCVEIEGVNKSRTASEMVVSLDIDPPDDFTPKKFGLALSRNPQIGYFRYLKTTPGLRRYFIHFSLPEATPCSSLKIRAWKGPGVLEVQTISLFGPEDIQGRQLV